LAVWKIIAYKKRMINGLKTQAKNDAFGYKKIFYAFNETSSPTSEKCTAIEVMTETVSLLTTS
jgi:hypothetical protein